MNEVEGSSERAETNPLVTLTSGYARPHAGHFLLGLVTLLLARVPERIPALLIGVSLDAILFDDTVYALPLVPSAWIPTSTSGQLWFTVVVLGVAILAESLLDWLSRHVYDHATLRMLHDVRTATYDAVVRLEMAYFDDHGSGEVMSILNNDVTNLRSLADAVYRGISYTSQVIVAFVFMALLNWQLALALAVVPLVLAMMGRVYATMVEPRYDAVRESVGVVNAHLQDAIDGIATVKAYTGEDHERERVRSSSNRYKAARWSAIRLRVAYSGTSWLWARGGERGLLLLGGYWVIAGPPWVFSGTLTPGTLLTFLLYARSLMGTVRNLAVDVIDNYENAKASGKRVASLLEHPSSRSAPLESETLDVSEGIVDFDDVTFTYRGTDEPAVRDVQFSAGPDELVGLVGPTGAGKSTLTKLLFRFYDPDAGTIRIDGRDVSTVSAESLREHVGYVSQDPFLFYGTAGENIAYALADARHDEVVAAAKRAGAHEFITELPDGYDTEVGERGVKLSGGQRQRIAIARALLRDPELLVFDEATSHVDNETERQIQERLYSLAGGRTTFVIAHRLSTVRDADRILVMDGGRLVEEGTHDDLVDDGLYADLWHVQIGDVSSVSEAFAERVLRDEGVGR